MKNHFFLIIVLVLAISGGAYVVWRSVKFKPDNWEVLFDNLGSSSSPRAADLNQDGIKDIVVGAGAKEFEKTDRAVLALDGRNGSVLWTMKAWNQVVGSAAFKDISRDGIPEVFIGGRSAILYCIDGNTGKLVWEYVSESTQPDIYNDTTILNFYESQFIPDMNNDGVEELLVAYGGFIKARPDEVDRPVGYLMIMNPLNGSVISKAKMPDGRETYMSPVIHDFNDDGEIEIIFGSGGETINGHLYKGLLSDLIKGDLSPSIVLDSGNGKGFIAPAILADINSDRVRDILVNSVNGRSMAFDGNSGKKIWEVSLGEGFEMYTMPAPGFFYGKDSIPDFFTSFGNGVWPEINFAINVVIDGKNGNVVYADTTDGTFQYASPVVFDMTKDGHDDVIFAMNGHATGKLGTGSIDYLQTMLTIYDFRKNVKLMADRPRLGTNLGSTPLLADLDNDDRLDIVYCYSHDAVDIFSFKRMKIERLETRLSIAKPLKWGSYMGSDFDGMFPKK